MTMLSFIDKHIRADVTALFREFERQSAHTSLHAKAKKLSAPFIGYEAAARAAGYNMLPYDDGGSLTWRDVCDDYHITPHEIPIIGHYIVSAELADKLEARGERVERDFGGNIVWARKSPYLSGENHGYFVSLDRDPVLVSIFEEGGL